MLSKYMVSLIDYCISFGCSYLMFSLHTSGEAKNKTKTSLILHVKSDYRHQWLSSIEEGSQATSYCVECDSVL